jgi:hypothetical protein
VLPWTALNRTLKGPDLRSVLAPPVNAESMTGSDIICDVDMLRSVGIGGLGLGSGMSML